MDIDRSKICEIISEMLDNPDENGIYPTSTAYTKLEHYIESVRIMAIGYTHSVACTALDKGDDPRTLNVPEILNKALEELG